jgi:hypothetical protein
VDGHVHFYPCYNQAAFVSGARNNFLAAAKALGLADGFQGCLLMTETARDHFFATWRREAAANRDGKLSMFRETAEDCALTLASPDAPPLSIIAGRQIVTAERLEVLALGHNGDFPDGRALDRTLAAVADSGALAVIPWAFGKWWSKRGRLVADQVEKSAPGKLFIGDNGGRPRCSGRPAIFSAARKQGLVILPGSDPLPFAGATARAGGYGFALKADWDATRPFASLKAGLQTAGTSIETFGTRVGPAKFFIDQLRMRF